MLTCAKCKSTWIAPPNNCPRCEAVYHRDDTANGLTTWGGVIAAIGWLGAIALIFLASIANSGSSSDMPIIFGAAAIANFFGCYILKAILHGIAEILRSNARMEDIAYRQSLEQDDEEPLTTEN
jgi:uncharacterized paraquat-inducible protein A